MTETGTCPECGATFPTYPGTPGRPRVYCGKVCAVRFGKRRLRKRRRW